MMFLPHPIAMGCHALGAMHFRLRMPCEGSPIRTSRPRCHLTGSSGLTLIKQPSHFPQDHAPLLEDPLAVGHGESSERRKPRHSLEHAKVDTARTQRTRPSPTPPACWIIFATSQMQVCFQQRLIVAQSYIQTCGSSFLGLGTPFRVLGKEHQQENQFAMRLLPHLRICGPSSLRVLLLSLLPQLRFCLEHPLSREWKAVCPVFLGLSLFNTYIYIYVYIYIYIYYMYVPPMKMCDLCLFMQCMWLWVKNRSPKWNPAKWIQRPKLVVPGGLMLTHTHNHESDGNLMSMPLADAEALAASSLYFFLMASACHVRTCPMGASFFLRVPAFAWVLKGNQKESQPFWGPT